jgi:carbamoyltransferase
MARYILGVSAFYHDSAAALLCDGKIIAAAQEERFSRRKHDPRFPRGAIDYCLEMAGIEIPDLDFVAFYERPFEKLERLLDTYRTFSPKGFQSFRLAIPFLVGGKLDATSYLRSELEGTNGDDQGVPQGGGEKKRKFRGEIVCVDHHASHAASAFFPSPFPEAAVLTLDAVGEWTTSSIGKAQSHEIQLTHELRFPHSVGMLYSAFTYYTGFKVNSGEYKLMGLAPYGDPRYVDTILANLVRIAEDGSIWMDMSYFSYCHGLTMTSEKFHELFGARPRHPESRITQREMDLAASVQAVCESVVLKAAEHAYRLTELPNLVMAGGVALNCVANGELARRGPFDRIWVQPAAGDAGGALGAALYLWHHILGNERHPVPEDSQSGSLLGPSYDVTDSALMLQSLGADFDNYNGHESGLLELVAKLMADGKVIGWFSGRMEYGPRALGSRSIIGDPRSPQMQQTMNLKIKFRESFRPFAPCVLREHAAEIFEVEDGFDSPYMLFVAPLKDEWRLPPTEEALSRSRDPDLTARLAIPRSTLPAITHVDFSARIQTVDEERHGRFYRLMKAFHHLTGCPVVVNTSFNIRGEPIVGTPFDAYRCFLATDMDYLVIDDLLLDKNRQSVNLLPGLEKYRTQQPLD